MNSKEALDWLYAVINKPEVCGGNEIDNKKAFEVIKQDLEVFDILKEHMQICVGGGGYMLFPIIKGRTKEAKKIKEWLNNDK